MAQSKLKCKASSSDTWVRRTTSLSTRAFLLLGATIVALRPSLAHANPQGGGISGGQATITQNGNELDIHQSSGRAIIDWNSFDIGANEKTVFYQPSSSSIALNRIHDNNPTQIFGQLDANGRVILINPNGVFFGPHSQINVNGILATTANIKNSDFMAGNMNFSQPGNPNAWITNQGSITAKDAGLVGFVAPNVENDGVITAKLGAVTLASGDTFILDMAGDNLIKVAASSNLKSQIASNTGTIQADGGTVTLTAAAAGAVVNSLVSNSGVIQANSIGTKDGHIYLYAAGSNAVADNNPANKGQGGGNSSVINRGTLRARGARRNETGGTITVTADYVGIISGSVIDASGKAGGGTINIGGDFHGEGTTPTALVTVVQDGALIEANALKSGNGGNVAIWSDQQTTFNGTVEVKAEGDSGDGGFVETSGRKNLVISYGTVSATSRRGRAGTWLLDPADVTISAGSDSGITGNPTFTPDGSQAESVINVSDITTALNAGTSVSVTTGGDSASGTNIGQITVATPITLSASSNNNATLTLSAYSNIVFNSNDGITAPTTGTGKLNVILDANNGSNGSGFIYLNPGANITTNGGNIIMGGGEANPSNIVPGTGYAVGSSSSGTQYGIYLSGVTLNAGGGNIVLNGQGGGYATNFGIYFPGSDTIRTSGGGTIALNGVGNSTGSDSEGIDSEASTSVISGSGAISITGTGGGNSSNDNFGEYLYAFNIAPTGTAPITITGTAGYGTVYGVNLVGTITSAGGTVTLASPTNIANKGTITYEAGTAFNVVFDADTAGAGGTIYISQPVSTDGGNIYLGGGTLSNGIPTGSATAYGGDVEGTYINHASLNAGGGNITMNGAVASGGSNAFYFSGATVQTSGAGNITITGTGLTTGTNNATIYIDKTGSASSITSTGNGTISILSGNAGGASNHYGLYTDSNGESIGGGSFSGNIVLQADLLSMGTGTTIQTSGNIQVEPYTATTAVNVATGSTGLQLTSTYLGYLNGGSLTIGSANDTGAMTIGSYSSWAAPVTFLTKSTGSISVTGNQTATGIGAFTFTGGPVTLAGNLTTAGGGITLNPAVTLGQNETINAGGGNVTFGSTADGDYNLTASAGTFSLAAAWGGSTPLSAVSLTSTNGLTLPAISASTIFAQTTGATADLTLTGQLTASATGTPVTLVASRNFINSDGAAALSLTGASSPRWLIYSTNPANNTLGGLTESFHRYSCTYGGSCPSFPATGNGLLYSLSPTITVTANNDSGTYGSIPAFSASYSGFINGDTAGTALSGSPSLTTNATTSTSGNWNAGTWTITSGAGSLASAMGYQLAYANGTLTVSQKALSITGLSGTNKVYDATTSDSVTGSASLNGVVANDVVNLSNGSASFADANVGNGKTVTFSGYTISGHDAGDYALSQPASSSANITAAGLTITAKNVSMTYADGTTLNGSTGFTEVGLLGSDSISWVTLATNASTSTSGNWNAGTWTITPSAATGSGLSNYSISYANAPVGLTVAQKAITITGLSGTNRTYDATASDSVTGSASLSGLVSGDIVTLNNGSASFSDPNVGNGKAVTFSGYSISGHDAGDYALSQPANSSANITAAGLTITAKNVSMTYADGTTLNGSTGFTEAGLLGSDSISSVTLATNASTSTSGNWNAGTWTITPSAAAGTGLSNYTITYANAPVGLTVAQKALTITGLSGTNKVYDTTTSDPVTGSATLNGVVAGDVVNLANGSASFADANVGTGKTVTFSGYSISGHDAGDYALGQPASTTANIAAAGLTITAKNVSMTYADGTTLNRTGGFTEAGLLGSDSITSVTLATNATTSTSGNWNAGTWTITPSAVSGSGLSNYSITYANAPVGLTVSQKALTITGLSGTNKVYDATTSDPVTGSASLNGVVANDVVNLSNGSASFADANVGNGKAITFSGYSIGGHDAGDYALSQPANSTANITAAGLTITAKNVSMTYADGTTLNGSTGFTEAGLLGSDSISSVTLATNASTSTSGNWNAGTWTITPSAAAGTGLSNYSITYANAPAGLTIAQKALSITGLSGTTKVYDATTSDPVTGSANLNGVVTIDVVTLINGSASFADPNVGNGKAVTFSGYSISGHDAGDYALSQPTSSTANITPAGLTVTADNKAKSYGSSDPVLTYAVSGLQGSDTAGGVLSGSLTRDPGENVGNYNINQGTMVSNNNYTLTYVPGTFTITTANILAVAADNKTMTYGSSLPTLTYTYSGLVNGDTSSVFSGALATTATSSSNVGSYNITQGTLSAGPNYTITFTAGTLTITPATLTVTANGGQHKTYGTADPALTYSYAGLENGDSSSAVSGSLSRVAGENVGNYAIGLGSLSAGSNYIISYTGANFAINPATLTITAKNLSMTYADGTALNTSNGYTETGLVGSDSISSVTLSTNATTSSSGNWNAGTWSITPSAAQGSGLSNYSITYANAPVGLTVAQKALLITGLSGTNKVYDATTSDPITGTAGLNGVVTNDVVTLNNGSASFADPNLGNGKAVNFSGYSISGHDAGDYVLSQPASSTANITPAGLTITAKNVSMTYADGTTLNGATGFTESGLLGSDSISSVTLATNASTSSSDNWNAGTWTITPSNASGTGLSNYSITYANASVGLAVTQKALAITGLSGTNKIYDGTTADPITGSASLSGLVSGDILTLNSGSASFADANVGNGKAVTLSGYSISGHDAWDYALSQPASSTANITPAMKVTLPSSVVALIDGEEESIAQVASSSGATSQKSLMNGRGVCFLAFVQEGLDYCGEVQ